MEHSNRFLIGLYDHEDTLLKAIKRIRGAEVEITDALTPFPVHGIEDALGMKGTRLHTAGFMFGMTGMIVALTLMIWTMGLNYPVNIGGKPFVAIPSFIPITFELTVLFAGVGMFFVYCFRNKLFPGRIPRIMDKRITDNMFALTFALAPDESADKIRQIEGLLEETGAVEVKEKVFNDEETMFDEE